MAEQDKPDFGALEALRRAAQEGAAAPSAAAFLERLREAYGASIGAQVARELGLEGASQRALAAREILRALDMADTARAALAGVNFMSRHAYSARARSTEFQSLCRELGADPAALSAACLAAADEGFARRFEQASGGHRRGVDLGEARELMRQALREALQAHPG